MADAYNTKFPDASTSPAMGSIPIDYGSGDQAPPAGRRVRGLYISTAGTLKMTFANGDVDSMVLAAGYHPLEIVLIWQTGSSTAAGNILF